MLAAGETTGPLTEGSNLCHCTGGNGDALLKLYARTRDETWFTRARSPVHGIGRVDADAARYVQLRYSP